MITLPLPKPPSLDGFPEVLRDYELPSVDDMHQRAFLADGTGYAQWALDAFYIRLVLEQAIVLNHIGRYIYQDAFEASELACDGRKKINHSLRTLQREIMFRAMDVFGKNARRDRLEEARQRRAEKKAAEHGADPPPKKRRKKGEGLTAPTVSPSSEKRTAPTVQTS